MNNKNMSIELNEKYIKDLTILKLKRNYGFIEREEFRNELINLGINNGISDYAEMLTFIAFNVIVDRIEEMQGDDKVKLLFNEIVEVPYEEDPDAGHRWYHCLRNHRKWAFSTTDYRANPTLLP